MIDLLLTDFFPDEPCAAGVSLCPPGYEIPALQADIRSMLGRGWSFLAEDPVSDSQLRPHVLDLGRRRTEWWPPSSATSSTRTAPPPR